MNHQHDSEFWFQRGEQDNPRFWARLGGRPPLDGLSVLDFGCGRGRLALDIARDGATRVVGVDLDPESLAFARSRLAGADAGLAGRVQFHGGGLDAFSDATFDLAVSKDTFEHVADLAGALTQIRRCLKPGGRLYAGFGPLYRFWNGDHGQTGIRFPWGHVLLPESWVLSRINRRRAMPARSLQEALDVNRLALADYRNLFRESGMRVVRFEVNCSEHWAAGVFRALRRLPGLEEYCTFNVYVILEKQKQ